MPTVIPILYSGKFSWGSNFRWTTGNSENKKHENFNQATFIAYCDIVYWHLKIGVWSELRVGAPHENKNHENFFGRVWRHFRKNFAPTKISCYTVAKPVQRLMYMYMSYRCLFFVQMMFCKMSMMTVSLRAWSIGLQKRSKFCCTQCTVVPSQWPSLWFSGAWSKNCHSLVPELLLGISVLHTEKYFSLCNEKLGLAWGWVYDTYCMCPTLSHACYSWALNAANWAKFGCKDLFCSFLWQAVGDNSSEGEERGTSVPHGRGLPGGWLSEPSGSWPGRLRSGKTKVRRCGCVCVCVCVCVWDEGEQDYAVLL